jgi:hypothetical protein
MWERGAAAIADRLTFVSARAVTISSVMLGLPKLPAHLASSALAVLVGAEPIGVPVPCDGEPFSPRHGPKPGGVAVWRRRRKFRSAEHAP